MGLSCTFPMATLSWILMKNPLSFFSIMAIPIKNILSPIEMLLSELLNKHIDLHFLYLESEYLIVWLRIYILSGLWTS